jgi:DNA-binding transcriptional MerR regulator
MVHEETADLLTTQEVAREEGTVCAATVRQWEKTGKLPAIRTASGMRLFRRADVNRLLAARRQARESKATTGRS